MSKINSREFDKTKNIDSEKNHSSLRTIREKGAEEGRKRKQTYLQLKSFALEREKLNYSKLFIIHEKGDWWKMVGHSAVLYHYYVSNRIGVRSKLVPDTDYDYCSDEGVVNIRDINSLNTKLIENKVNPLEITSAYRIYNIGKKFSPADIQTMKQDKILEWNRINKIILPEDVFPAIFAKLRELLKRIYFSTRSFDQYLRRVVAEPMLGCAVLLLNDYSLMSKGNGLSAAEFLKKLDKKMNWMAAQIIAIEELNLMTPERIFQILRITESIKREIIRCHPKKI